MYLDDGVSRESAPTATGLQKSFAANVAFNTGSAPPSKNAVQVLQTDAFGDEEAADVYWKVRIKQVRFAELFFVVVAVCSPAKVNGTGDGPCRPESQHSNPDKTDRSGCYYYNYPQPSEV